MSEEEYLPRFIWLVILFVLSINMLIFVPNILFVILGWDGLGLVSFLLVVYYQNHKSLGAGIVTALINRVGDAFLLIRIALIRMTGEWSMEGWSIPSNSSSLLALILVLLAMTKRAQIPFSYWLPAAINAPTPVSALVHSSTLVTAGVYLLIRISGGIGIDDPGRTLLLWTSLFTINIAGLCACFETDFKKVVALSTLRQLGVMIFSIRIGNYILSFFHLMSHALFKALIFVRVGRVIHASFDSQELRRIGGLWFKIPLTRGCLVLASISLIGLPFLRGFYSKDLVIEMYLAGELNFIVLVLVLSGVCTTVLYSGRVISCCIIGKGSNSLSITENKTIYEALPRIGLGLGALLGAWWIQSTLYRFDSIVVLETKYKFMVILRILSASAVVLAYNIYSRPTSTKIIPTLIPLNKFFWSMWFSSYVAYLSRFLGLKTRLTLVKDVDIGWNEHVYGGLGFFDSLTKKRALTLTESKGILWERAELGVMIVLLASFIYYL